MATTRRGEKGTAQLLWRVRPAPRPAPTSASPTAGIGHAGLEEPGCAGVVIEHVDGTEQCELGPHCRAGLDDHDVGADCPGPEDGCRHCRSVFRRCDAPVVEHGPGDGTGPLVCTAGHDADDLDATEDTDQAGQRVYHPGHDTYPCATPDCPRCTDTDTAAEPDSANDSDRLLA